MIADAQGFEPWAFTGSRIRHPLAPLSPDEEQLVRAQLDDLPDHALVITGGARGVDALINAAALLRGLHRLAILPAVTNWTDWAAIKSAVIIRTRLSGLDRNQKIVDAARHLRAIGVKEPAKEPRSGTWACARMAQRAGILDRVVILRPTRADGPVSRDGNDVCVCSGHCPCAKLLPCPCAHHLHAELVEI